MKVLIFITHGNIGGATNSVFWLAKGLKNPKLKISINFRKKKFLLKFFKT